MRTVALLVCVLIAAGGCSKEAAPTVEEAFKDAPRPELETMVKEAEAAYERKDYPKAVMNLQALRSDPTISADQLTAVQDRMARIQTDLANRAEAGDKQAQEALRMLQTMPRR